MAVAKDFLEAVQKRVDGSSGGSMLATVLPPLGVREWLVQEQVRTWLIAVFSRTDPIRLMEVDLILERGKVGPAYIFGDKGGADSPFVTSHEGFGAAFVCVNFPAARLQAAARSTA